jgi:ABC-type cobalamin/Fe3+-siderophores transport system ATPase subunit
VYNIQKLERKCHSRLPARPENVFNYTARDIALMGVNPYMEWWRDYAAPAAKLNEEMIKETYDI